MSLPQLQLAEPLVAALVTVLSNGLNTTIDALNASNSDGFKVDHAAQFLDYVPVPSSIEGGLPAIGVQRLGGQFMDDLQTNMDAEHRYAIVAIIQNADHRSLAKQVERTLQAVAYTVQQDRLAGTPAGTTSVMKTQGGAWSVNFDGYDPGPLLADLDPTSPEAPPRSYMSYASLTLVSKRTEV